jgi:serine/threonine protein phosphatase 1
MDSAFESEAKRPKPANKFAQFRGGLRVWAISAVHGAAPRLARLHDAISESFQEGDRLVYLGNYIGYGSTVLETVDELLDFRRRVLGRRYGCSCDVAVLRGAQEEMWQKLLQLQFAPNPGEVLEWMVKAGMEAAVRAYGGDLQQGFAAARDGPRSITRWTGALRRAMNEAPGHTALFSALRHAAFTADQGMLFVPAAIDPLRPLASQGDAFWWGHDDILALDTSFAGFRRVIRGIDRQQRGFAERVFAVSLDGGKGHPGRLLAACFSADGEVIKLVEA